MEIGQKIRTLRKEHNLSQEQFAEKFHVTRQAVSNWENGKNYPDMKIIDMISEEFGISFDELMKGDDELMYEIDRKGRLAGRWKKLFIVVCAVLVITAVVAGIPHMAGIIFYNPNDVVAENTYEDGAVIPTHRMESDVNVFSRLTMPGYIFDSVQTAETGAGRYNITISQSMRYLGEKGRSVSGEIIRNNMLLYNADIFRKPYDNSFEWYGKETETGKSLEEIILRKKEEFQKNQDDTFSITTGMAGEPADSKANLRTLNSEDYYEAYISFNNIMNYEDAYLWKEKCSAGNKWWAAVVTDRRQNNIMGFYTDFSGIMNAYKDQYPSLFGYSKDTDDVRLKTEAKAQEHFTSMLKYLQDQTTFIKMMKKLGLVDEYFPEMLTNADTYVRENGIKVYGMAVTARKDELIRIHEMPEFFSIAVEKY